MSFRAFFTIAILSLSSICLSQELLPIDSIMKRAMDVSEMYNRMVEQFDADLYMRTYVETLKKNFLYRYTHLVPGGLVLHNRKADESIIESISTLRFTYPNSYVQDIKYVTGTLTSKKDIDMLPFSFMNFNVYGETTSNESLFLPLRENSKKYYRYSVSHVHTENDKIYYTIDYLPIQKNAKLLKGSFVLEYGSWRVVQFTGEFTDLLSEYMFEVTMGEEWLTNFLPVEFSIYQKTMYLGNEIAFRYLANIDYKTVKLRDGKKAEKRMNISNLYKVRLDSVPLYNDSVFWEANRPIPLQAKEKEILDKFEQKRRVALFEKVGKDSADISMKNALKFAQSMVMDTRYTYKSTNIKYGGILNPALIGYSSEDGLTYRQKIFLNIDLKDNRNIHINAFAGYMFKRKELFTDLSFKWNYNPMHLGNFLISVGNGNRTYSSLFINEIQDRLIENGLDVEDLSLSYFKDYYARLSNSVEVANGLQIGTGLHYHIRKVVKTPKTRLATSSLEEIDNMLKDRYSFAPLLRLTWTPEQYYRLDGRQKIYVRSRYPTFKIEFARSIKGIFRSISEYNRFEFDISHRINLGLMKRFQYHMGAGVFTNQRSEYFADFHYFQKRNFPENWDDGIGGVFNLLDRDLYNASTSYVQVHLMYETPFLLLNDIPLLSRGVVRERLYLSQLYTPYIRYYNELGYGIGNRFLNAALFGSFYKLKFNKIGFKVSMNL